MSHKPMDFEEMDRLFRYESETGDIFNKIDRGYRGRVAKAGAIATSRHNKGYLRVQVTKDGYRVGYLAHRVAWLLHTGEDPGDLEIDHIDGRRDRNNFSNLRLVDRQDNMENKREYKNNTSGITGIYWHKVTGKWAVSISARDKRRHIGVFEDFFEACCARKSAERRLGYHPNHGK